MTLRFIIEHNRAQDAREEQEALAQRFKVQKPLIPVVLCNDEGEYVDANGSPVNATTATDENYVWAREWGESIPKPYLSRRGVEPIGGTPCLAGYAEDSLEQEILGVFEIDPSPTRPAAHRRHAREHEPGGYDPLNIYTRMLVPLRATPLTGLTLQIAPFIYDYQGERKIYQGTNSFNAAAHLPAAGLALRLLIYLDPADNTIKTVAGSTVTDSLAFTPPLPDPPDGSYPSAWVRLAGGQSQVDEVRDVLDARQVLVRWGGDGPLSNFTATADPTANDDSGDGYGVGSLWINVTDDTAWICLDATTSAAVWQEMGGGAVDSVFGRTGAVVAAASDYDADQVDYDNTASGLAAADVQAAIDEIVDEMPAGVDPAGHSHSQLDAPDGSPAPALEVDAAGQVGIGITPTNKLTVSDTATPVSFERVLAGNGNNANAFLLKRSNASAVAGDGIGLILQAKDTAGNDVNIGGVEAKITDITSNAGPGFGAIGALLLKTKAAGSQFESEKMRILGNGNVGIGTTAPDATLDVNGTLALRIGGLSLSNGDNNNVFLDTSFTRITGPTGAFAVTGAGVVFNGRVAILWNSTSQTMTIKHQNASSSATQRIITPTGADVVAKSATLIYSSTDSRWLLVSYV